VEEVYTETPDNKDSLQPWQQYADALKTATQNNRGRSSALCLVNLQLLRDATKPPLLRLVDRLPGCKVVGPRLQTIYGLLFTNLQHPSAKFHGFSVKPVTVNSAASDLLGPSAGPVLRPSDLPLLVVTSPSRGVATRLDRRHWLRRLIDFSRDETRKALHCQPSGRWVPCVQDSLRESLRWETANFPWPLELSACSAVAALP